MIAEYRAPERSFLLNAPRQYALGQTHKHLKEMKAVTGLANEPVFCPVVADFYSGMQVTVPLFASWLAPGAGMGDVKNAYRTLYTGPVVSYTDAADEGGFLSAAAQSGLDSMKITVAGNEQRMLLLAVYDNLGKGASGAAVECMNLVTGAEKRWVWNCNREEPQMKQISGGVCAATGFSASGVHCGIRKNKTKRDLALIYSSVPASAAAVYTTNLVKGAPLVVTKQHLADGKAQAIICNSGNANTCNANGIEIAEQMSSLLGQALHIKPSDVVVASTGVIGQPLDIAPIAAGIPELVKCLGPHSDEAAEGIMTTDTKRKEIAISFTAGGKVCKIGGICKGSGMIHPNMATMLVFITTDCAISPAMLQKALLTDIANTFNMVSVDGDTSTNDMVTVLANGLAGNPEITEEDADFTAFMQALNTVTVYLCRCIAGDGEGATKLLECKVSGAPTLEIAKTVAKSVICSSLTKAAMFGADANWGRVLCAIGYSGAPVDVNKIDVQFASKAGTILVCENGAGVEFSEEQAKKILLEHEIEILIDLKSGSAASTAWGCDLTYDYVKINGDYRT